MALAESYFSVKRGFNVTICKRLISIFYILNHNHNHNLFSFRGSVQDYKIHMDMEIVKFA